MKFFSREIHKEHNRKVYWTLTYRHFKMFFKNKISVVFSLLVPMITLIIYIIFLRQLQVNAIDSSLDKLLKDYTLLKQTYDKAHLLADSWMLSGIVAVSCISVSLNTCNIAIIDKTTGINKDFMSSPISRRSVNVSYILFNFLATSLIIFCVMIVTFIYLGAIGGFQISIGRVFLTIPVMLLSVLSASLITCFLASFISNFNTFNSSMVIISSASGFLIGAYMPVSMLPGAFAKRLTLFFPGTYSASLFRNLFMADYYNNFKKYLLEVQKVKPTDLANIEKQLSETFSINLDFFGKSLSLGYMVLAIFIFIALFILLNIMFLDRNYIASVQGKKRLFKRKK